jgi:GNAT superfamily N-acetyltransferase
MSEKLTIAVRNTRPEDFPGIIALCAKVYPQTPPWGDSQLASHVTVFPQGQFVAVDASGRIIGMAASLMVRWDDYKIDHSWRDMTDGGMFTNHDPEGRTLYGAEIMVDPEMQGRGVGKAIYGARRELVLRLGLLRIRAGARLRDYHRVASEMSAEDYVRRVVHGELIDRTLTFQLRRHFHVLAVVKGYLRNDPESLGYAAVIEWINKRVAKSRDYAARKRAEARFR